VLRAFHRARIGLDAQLFIPAPNRIVNRDTYHKVSSWDDNDIWVSSAIHIKADLHVFERKIIKEEGHGGEVNIFLQIEWLSDDEIGDTIENPIVIEDNDK